ncbi:hypothetical protein VNO80_24552 [Phaseolus coccineus]|uniref:Uncharacterized protein n=1 Tax=Phaseolus coccineus TaxID=3886 RepID=A0AAN9QL47_PHACN
MLARGLQGTVDKEEACMGGDGVGGVRGWRRRRARAVAARLPRATARRGRCDAVVQGRRREVRWWRDTVIASVGVRSWRGAGRDGEVRRHKAQGFRGGEGQRSAVFTGAASGLGNDDKEECAEEVEETQEIREE